jgi:hypothetical protein
MFSGRTMKIDDIDGEPLTGQPRAPVCDRIMIDSVGDIRAVLGSQGKSICVSGGAEAIAVLYGRPSGDPDNSMIVSVAYSVDSGATWTVYSPFSAPVRRMYNSVDGAPDFNTWGGHLWFIWQENTLGYNDGALYVMIEENIPAQPSFSVPIGLTQAPDMYPWEPDIAVDPDDPQNLVATAFSWLANGNEWAYCWISHDGGYTWTDTIPMAHISPDGSAGNLSRGTGGYVVYAYLDYGDVGLNDSTPVPYYIESTDGGYTWSDETRVPNVPANASSQFWWHEFECLVINDEPWFVFNDIGTPGGGPYVIRGYGSPGNWVWSVWDAGVIGFDSTVFGSTLWYCKPSQYPSLAYNPVNNMIVCTYKSDVIITPTHDGPHIQGIYTFDNGAHWYISDPLSAATTTIYWGDWNATETAHHLVHFDGYSKAYSVWIDEPALTMYFESEYVTPWGWPGIEEANYKAAWLNDLHITPIIASNSFRICFTMPYGCFVSARIYDVGGKLVSTPFAEELSRGTYKKTINTSNLSSGTHFAVLETGSCKQVEKIIVVR